jgi:DUF1365 family protein
MSTSSEAIFTNAIYSGKIRHERYVDAKHGFDYRMFCLWLKVSEIDQPSLKWPGVGRGAFGVVTVRAEDYLAGRAEKTLNHRLKAEIQDKTGLVWEGEAYLLAQPRYFGFIMNPLSLYYCYDTAGSLVFVVGEITNTPWGERHCYVFSISTQDGQRADTFELAKEFHVSPFLPMNMQYTWRFTKPGNRLAVGIWNHKDGRLDFEAHMTLERARLNRFNMMINVIKMPLMTWKIWFGIYINAGILYAIKRVTFYSHPKKIIKDKGVS